MEESTSINRGIAHNNRSFSKTTRAQVDILAASINVNEYKKARIAKLREVINNEIKRLPVSLSAQQRSKMAISISKYSDMFDVPAALMMGLVRQESAFNPRAVSWAGAKGLGQIMDPTADDIKQWLGPKFPGSFKPFRIDHSLLFSAFYLSRMLDIFEYDRGMAIMAYNTGPKRILKLILRENCVLDWENHKNSRGPVGNNCGHEIKLEKETVDYVIRVLQYVDRYEELGVH